METWVAVDYLAPRVSQIRFQRICHLRNIIVFCNRVSGKHHDLVERMPRTTSGCHLNVN